MIRLIKVKDTQNIDFAICFDPNGQITFVNLNTILELTFENVDVLELEETETNLTDPFIKGVLGKVSTSLSGVVFYDGLEYLFCNKGDKGDFIKKSYKITDVDYIDSISFPQTFIIINLEELKENPEFILQVTKENYQLIQQQQLITNKENLNDIITSIDSLNKILIYFKEVYEGYNNDIVSDWNLLSKFSNDYYKKFSKGVLTQDEKTNYDQVSVNMFVRFQLFNDQVEVVDQLKNIKNNIENTINKFSSSIEKMEKNRNISGKIIDKKEIEDYI